AYRPLVGLFGEQRTDQAHDRGPVGEDADQVGAAADLAVQPLERVVIPYERRWMPAVTLDRLDAGGVRVGEYGATVRDGGIWERTQVGQAVGSYGLRARWCTWPPLRLARMCRERGVRHEASIDRVE